jgi:hypothetical protein
VRDGVKEGRGDGNGSRRGQEEDAMKLKEKADRKRALERRLHGGEEGRRGNSNSRSRWSLVLDMLSIVFGVGLHLLVNVLLIQQRRDLGAVVMTVRSLPHLPWRASEVQDDLVDPSLLHLRDLWDESETKDVIDDPLSMQHTMAIRILFKNEGIEELGFTPTIDRDGHVQTSSLFPYYPDRSLLNGLSGPEMESRHDKSQTIHQQLAIQHDNCEDSRVGWISSNMEVCPLMCRELFRRLAEVQVK